MPKRTLLIVGLVITIGAVGTIGWFFFGGAIQERLSRRQFDLVTWQAASIGSTNKVRIRMVDDLLHRHQFRGMTREQVTAVIGEPDKTEYFKEWDMVYWLGQERGFISIDSEWLVFKLGSQKKVVDYNIVSD
jgi:hypothetical protein